MLLDRILEEDLLNCQMAFKQDTQLKECEQKLFELLEKCPKKLFLDLEETINQYEARAVRIAYLQGLKDFAGLYITLNQDIHELLQQCP